MVFTRVHFRTHHNMKTRKEYNNNKKVINSFDELPRVEQSFDKHNTWVYCYIHKTNDKNNNESKYEQRIK